MNYQEALSWIHSKVKKGEKPGLKRIKWLLEQFDNPQDRLAAIHLVGTNGKGSTVSYLKDIFCASGYKVGTFTSPFIVEFRERISVNGHMMSEEDLIAMVKKVEPVVESLPAKTGYAPATEFEIITLIMFLYFTELNPVDLAIIEAGLGGLLDATNVFQALAVVCPSIGLDHQELLGETYSDIAGQKVGVLKDREPFIFATDKKEVRQVFQAKAQETASPLYELGKDFTIACKKEGFDFTYQATTLKNIHLAMLGRHQKQNASLAVMTSLILKEAFPKVTSASIIKGLSQSKWVGRTEFLENQFMIDGAHNNESIQALVQLMQEDFSDKDITILFAAINSKPVDDMLKQLSQVGQVFVTSFDFPKCLALEDYPKKYPQLRDYKKWLLEKQAQLKNKNQLLLVTGSLYFISEVRQFVLEHKRINDTKIIDQ
ncbi:bifunctional folylpolyglutamate synthase/dihydrofolate synthase [Streptococcus didelphis]|uniref:Bifunctional folylpolyglutamate synthase/dihydrofolate synthase n=1 Tax=Streptococcus didelphis TaxID=102886 RepID=A0ABY9LI86_9STRE|nr:folylpolyglutamate synthase/dihydrofolate synthase family protein [Streptococcus didelphis]WMB28438.1 bifunctional folylpolyglutamate synthase/dihydrofolate synthase [Streptococcus didelphis]